MILTVLAQLPVVTTRTVLQIVEIKETSWVLRSSRSANRKGKSNSRCHMRTYVCVCVCGCVCVCVRARAHTLAHMHMYM